MELLHYCARYQVLCCTQCKTAIHPRAIGKHLRTAHARHPLLASHKLVRTFVQDALPQIVTGPLTDPHSEPLELPTGECEPFPYLKIHEGFGCIYCSFVSEVPTTTRKHYNTHHTAIRRTRGGQKCSGSRALREQLEREHLGDRTPWEPVHFQRFFRKGCGSTGFRVKRSEASIDQSSVSQDAGSTRQDLDAITDDIFRTLATFEQQKTQAASICQDVEVKSQVSPWLERTRWKHYLHGVCLRDAAQLARLPRLDEPVLGELAASIDRLVESAYASVYEDRINFFAQKCITSFLPAKKAYSQPLMVKLQKATYRQYKDLWKRLICFAYRSSQQSHSIKLRHRLNGQQTALLDCLVHAGARSTDDESNKKMSTCLDEYSQWLHHVDDLCLDFCISLLDHELKGDLFESVVLGFLAVLGIDQGNATFYEAPNYTSKLSGFIKIGQMLVLQKAVRKVEQHDADFQSVPEQPPKKKFGVAFRWRHDHGALDRQYSRAINSRIHNFIRNLRPY